MHSKATPDGVAFLVTIESSGLSACQWIGFREFAHSLGNRFLMGEVRNGGIVALSLRERTTAPGVNGFVRW